jgi:2,4-dienoyl-CoA reductase-like NADH-dependent reductase (Old Yellow Enzyme family)
MPHLFSPMKIRELTIPNRIWLSPMCMYSAVDGMPNDWHFAHLAQYAIRRVGFLMTEASGISPTGRSTLMDTGIWNSEQAKAWSRIVDFVHSQGSKIGIQLWHAGQKSSTTSPWQGQDYVPPAAGGWHPMAPSEVAFGKLPTPHALELDEIKSIIADYRNAASHALSAGFDVVEIHGAHGYLVHSFLSPITNKRSDQYGGSFENRTRFVKEVATSIREVWPASHPLFLRLSADDWIEGGWRVGDSARLAKELSPLGVDLIDASSGGIKTDVTYPIGPGYQVPFAKEIREVSGVPTAAVGLLTDAKIANEVVTRGEADAIMLGRELLRNPNWALNAAMELKDLIPADELTIAWPNQYLNGRPKLKPDW